ncbi:AMP-binding protein, partial [Nocardia sp. NPDC059764]|uniref:AMP-binding protein n=1 Tax=Nocardia sp. NPDC059764 TaxID=3346939 RepID=UPI0036577621
MLNLAVLLEDTARRNPGRDAIVAGDQRLTYAQVDAAANRIAHLLAAHDIRPGDKVALSCPNLAWFPIIYYGILKAGATVVPLNILLKDREIAYHLDDSGAKAFFCFEGTPELPMGEYGRAGFDRALDCRHLFIIDSPAPQDVAEPGALAITLRAYSGEFGTRTMNPDDAAVILYTSGTTGAPKGAQLTHANMLLNAFTANRQFGSHPGRHDRHLLVLPPPPARSSNANSEPITENGCAAASLPTEAIGDPEGEHHAAIRQNRRRHRRGPGAGPG